MLHATYSTTEGLKNLAVTLLTQEKGKELKHGQWAKYKLLRSLSLLWVWDKEQHSQHQSCRPTFCSLELATSGEENTGTETAATHSPAYFFIG